MDIVKALRAFCRFFTREGRTSNIKERAAGVVTRGASDIGHRSVFRMAEDCSELGAMEAFVELTQPYIFKCVSEGTLYQGTLPKSSALYLSKLISESGPATVKFNPIWDGSIKTLQIGLVAKEVRLVCVSWHEPADAAVSTGKVSRSPINL